MSSSKNGLSRRELFRRAGMAGAAAVVPAATAGALAGDAVDVQTAVPATQDQSARREALETLTAAEAETLEAMVARLIPTDENGPGAAEARAAHYIDRALGGALASSRDAYRSGLGALNRYAQSSKGAAFARLSAPDQDAVLRDMETNAATGFAPSASAFFNLVRGHTIEGTFSDPYYGGNANFIGWDLLSYPGIRLAVGANEQRMDVKPAPLHRSAYDHAMFSKKKPARASNDRGTSTYGD